MTFQLASMFDAGQKGRAAADADHKRNALAKFLQPAMQGDQNAYGALYKAGAGAEAMDAQQFATSQQEAQRKQKEANQGQGARLAAEFTRNPTPEMARMLVPHLRSLDPQFQAIPDNAWDDEAGREPFMRAAQILASVGADNTPAGVREFQMMTQGLDPAEVARARRVSLGLDPRAVTTSPNIMKADDGSLWAVTPNGMQQVPMGGGAVAPTTDGGGQVLQDAEADAYVPHIMQVESGGNPNAVSPKGARGLMQLMPPTAREVERALGMPPGETDRNPEANRKAGEWYYQQQLQRFGDPRLALAAYNGGPNRLAGILGKTGGNADAAIARMPPETRAYVPKVMGRMGGQQVAGGPTFGKKTETPRPSALQTRIEEARRLGATPEQLRQMVTGIKPTPTAQKSAAGAPVKMAQLQNVERGLERIEKALKDVGGGMVNTGPLDAMFTSRTPKGQELEAAVGAINESLLALTRVPGMGAQSDLEAKIAGLKFPSLDKHPEVNAETYKQLRAFVDDIKRGMQPPSAQTAPAANGWNIRRK